MWLSQAHLHPRAVRGKHDDIVAFPPFISKSCWQRDSAEREVIAHASRVGATAQHFKP